MNQFTEAFDATPVPLDQIVAAGKTPRTPAGLQSRAMLRRRRIVFTALMAVSMVILTYMLARAFAVGGWAPADLVILACFMVGAPWTVMGAWNALIGFWLLHLRRGGVAAAAPHLDAMQRVGPLTSRTALAMTVRNEDPARSFSRLVEMRRALDATGHGTQFDVFILSDTTDPAIATAEEETFARMRDALGGPRAHYRRRRTNTAFKAGNVRDFLLREGRAYDFYLPLDSDSLMSGRTIVDMVRVMEAHPRIGILQSLITGAPARSGFARIFQFGMRHGMRTFTLGASWWQGDCGPYWGHNALIRADAFRRHCRLPVLPGGGPLGGHILSHDQIEAVLMRRAGYEVRVLPVETESWEENPPTLMDFTKRDLRWCQGNMQYWPLVGLRGLQPTSRWQVFAAIAMYFGAPAWMMMTVAATFLLVDGEPGGIDLAFGIAMFCIMFAVSLVPKLVGLLDIVLTRGGVARYGGAGRFAVSAIAETIFSILMAPVVAFRITLFMIGLVFGRTITWGAQNRDAYRLSWADAARGLWPQTLFGLSILTIIVSAAGWSALAWAAPILVGLIGAIPFAVLTAHPAFGDWAVRHGLCAIPDEIAPAESLQRTEGLVPQAA